MRVLLTGGSGLLGRMMLGRKPADIEVIAVRHRREVTGADRTLTADLTDQVAVARMMERLRPDLVVHLAYAKASRPGIVDATAHLVSAATPLVLASTDNVFAGDGRPVAEHHPPDPVNDYGRWKAEAEALVLTFERSGVVRLPLLIDRAGLDDTSRAVRAAAEGAGPAPGWYAEEIRQPAFLDDVAEAMWSIALRPDRPGIWHLAGPERLTRPELGGRLAARLGVMDHGRSVPSPPPDERPRDLWLTDDRARRSLGWAPSPIR